ncbi:MAG: hypothetical protein FWH25_02135 [Syntrophorhabdaceae bacterium]|nr:hypothetical protein [Syntrophorhabdaceae bacterium]
MTPRLLPWAVFIAIVAGFGFLMPKLEKGMYVSESQRAERKGLSALEIRLEPVDMREFRDDGACNRLVASEAVYRYADRTVEGTKVKIYMEAEGGLRKIGNSDLRAARAFWDFDRERIKLPDGGQGESEQGWNVDMAPAELDLKTRVLRAPGKTSMSGPGLFIIGDNLRWDWPTGKISLVSPVSQILPSSLPVKTR